MAERKIPTREALASLLAALHYGQYSTPDDLFILKRNIERALRDFDIGSGVFVTYGVALPRMTEDEIHARDWWCPHCRVDVPPEMVTKDGEHYLESGGCGRAVRGELKDADGVASVEPPSTEPKCNPHPDAPHGFNRNASHNAGRYVCDCEGWEPDGVAPTDGGEQ